MIDKMIFGFLGLLFLLIADSQAQSSKIKLGAYYFDGWTGVDTNHITSRLRNKDFADREPKWGWITSQQETVDQQILIASESGISFFAFCKYYPEKNSAKASALNNALGFYQLSKYHSKMGYCLTVINHAGFTINAEKWNKISPEWVELFKSDRYVKVNGKALLIFYSLPSLINEFGGKKNVRDAFDRLRKLALLKQLKGVTIAICVKPLESQIRDAEECGVDLLTGYNYHEYGYVGTTQKIPLENLQKSEIDVWNDISSLSSTKYMPAITLNWDPRPWANRSNNYDTQHYYSGFSIETVKSSVKNAINWLSQHKQASTKENLAIIYAWNENGEGAWLTPGKYGFRPLQGVKLALENE